MSLTYDCCTLCPRMCRVDRTKTVGYCKATDKVMAARAALHKWEEPCISGTRGSGAVFFSNCTLKCIFCQNYRISHEGFGKEISAERLADIFLELEDQGAHNINLVTPTHYLPSVIRALDIAKPKLDIPIVYNCGGYERVETVRELEGYVDIYLPDLKYFDDGLAKKYSNAPEYFRIALAAIKEMIRQVKNLVYDSEGLMKKGVIVRHMVLPGCRNDSINLLRNMSEELPKGDYLVSIMSQYTPFYKAAKYPEIDRRITTYEYESVIEEAIRLGLTDGFMQEKSSAKEEYTPPFDLEGV